MFVSECVSVRAARRLLSIQARWGLLVAHKSREQNDPEPLNAVAAAAAATSGGGGGGGDGECGHLQVDLPFCKAHSNAHAWTQTQSEVNLRPSAGQLEQR